jgi:hypothetical protein
MMRFPDTSKGELAHLYDPVKAHEYYERTKKLKGRKKGGAEAVKGILGRAGMSKATNLRKQDAIATKKARIDQQIRDLSSRLSKLNEELKKRMAEAKKSEVKEKRAAREAAKPDTAAEKREAAKSSKDWRAKNQQKVKNQAKERASKEKSSSGGAGGSSGKGSKPKAGSSSSVEDLKASIGKVRTALAAAQARRRALG